MKTYSATRLYLDHFEISPQWKTTKKIALGAKLGKYGNSLICYVAGSIVFIERLVGT